MGPWDRNAGVGPFRVAFFVQASNICWWGGLAQFLGVAMATLMTRTQANINSQIKAEAIRSLKRFKSTGFEVNPEDQEQIQAFLVLRNSVARVSAKSFVKYLQERQTSITNVANAELEYWAVPKMNFPDGLPDPLLSAVVLAEDLAEAQLLGGTTLDHENYFVVDKMADRKDLGKNVRTLKYLMGVNTKVALPGLLGPDEEGPEGQAPVPTGGQPLAAPMNVAVPATSGGQPQAEVAIEILKPNEPEAAARGLVRSASDTRDPEDRLVKRRRLLSETLKDLREAISVAAEAGRWHSNSDWCHDTVNFLANELLQVLTNIVQEQMGAATGALAADAGAEAQTATLPVSVTKLLNKVYDFLAGVFKNSPMFEDLLHFPDLFSKLTTMGADQRGDGLLIEALAKADVGSMKQVDMSIADVVDRNEFRHSALYHSYCQDMFQRLLDKARVALAMGGSCDEELKEALQVRPVPQDLLDHALRAQKLFCGNPSARQCMDLWGTNPAVIGKFLRLWAPNHSLTLATQMIDDEDVSFQAWHFDTWVKGASYLHYADVQAPNPAIEASVTFLMRIAEMTKDGLLDGPLYKLLAKSIPTRLGMRVEQAVADFDVCEWLEGDTGDVDLQQVQKGLVEFWKTTPKGTYRPEWVPRAQKVLEFKLKPLHKEPAEPRAPKGSKASNVQAPTNAPANTVAAPGATGLAADKVAAPGVTGLAADAVAAPGATGLAADAEPEAEAEAAMGATEATTEEGAVEEGADAAEEDANKASGAQRKAGKDDFIKGDIVIGKSGKSKDKYNNIRCVVLNVLSTQLKVELLEGPCTGDIHKYTFANVEILKVNDAEPNGEILLASAAPTEAVAPTEDPPNTEGGANTDGATTTAGAAATGAAGSADSSAPPDVAVAEGRPEEVPIPTPPAVIAVDDMWEIF